MYDGCTTQHNTTTYIYISYRGLNRKLSLLSMLVLQLEEKTLKDICLEHAAAARVSVDLPNGTGAAAAAKEPPAPPMQAKPRQNCMHAPSIHAPRMHAARREELPRGC